MSSARRGLLTATIGRVVAIVPATSLSDSFLVDGSLYGITARHQDKLLRAHEQGSSVLRSSLRMSFREAMTVDTAPLYHNSLRGE